MMNAYIIGIVAVFVLAGPHFLANPVFNAPGWWWLGLSTMPPDSVDYVPVFPWLGVVLGGVVAGRIIAGHTDRPLWRWSPKGRAGRGLILAGRWSLPIYLVHQPILLGLIILAMPLLGPSEDALAGQLTSEYQSACALAGFEEEDCNRYAACILDGLGKEEGILAAAYRHDLTPEQVERWEIVVAECRVRALPPPNLDDSV